MTNQRPTYHLVFFYCATFSVFIFIFPFFQKKARGQHPADNTGAHGIDSGRTKSRRHWANVTVMGRACAQDLFLLSRASSDAYEPYMFLKDHSEESLTPGVTSEIPKS